MNEDIRKYLAEFIGTFTLVFIGTSVATLQGGVILAPGPYGAAGLIMVAFAFGATLGVMVLVIGPVSGCHINPAVTIPMVISGRLKASLAPGYIIAQCLGAIAASGVLMTLAKGVTGYELGKHGLGANGNWAVITQTSAFEWELVMTALFLFTIFAATRSNFTPGFHAVAIGGFLFVAHLIGVQLGDSSLNPARSLGPALLSGSMEGLWVFIVGPIIGGIIGWVIYKVIYAD